MSPASYECSTFLHHSHVYSYDRGLSTNFVWQVVFFQKEPPCLQCSVLLASAQFSENWYSLNSLVHSPGVEGGRISKSRRPENVRDHYEFAGLPTHRLAKMDGQSNPVNFKMALSSLKYTGFSDLLFSG